MHPDIGPLLTLDVHQALLAARDAGALGLQCSLDLGRSRVTLKPEADHWRLGERTWPYAGTCKARTIYRWDGSAFDALARYSGALVKLVPTEWGAPTFEIDGIKMLPTARTCPYADAQRKVTLLRPTGKRILDTCGGLGYFADCAVRAGAASVSSFEKNPDVIWLRGFNPWSPAHAPRGTAGAALTLTQADIVREIDHLPDAAFDAVLHDPPRFGIAGELYAQSFYDQLARVLAPRGRLFHYTGTPNRITSGRDVPREVSRRLERAGFRVQPAGDGLLGERL